MSITVKTKSELESAIESGGQEIIVVGELAEKTYDARNIKKLGSVSMAILGGVAIAAIPFTSGLSVPLAFAAAFPIAGLSTACIVAITFLGTALVLKMVENYDVVDFKCSAYGVNAELHLRRKQD